MTALSRTLLCAPVFIAIIIAIILFRSNVSAATTATLRQTSFSQSRPSSQIASVFLRELAVDNESPINMQETPTSADSFVNSIGVNAHFENYHSTYVTHFSQVETLLSSAGIRHVRIGMLFGHPAFFDLTHQLGIAGIHGDFVTRPTYTQSQIQDYPQSVGSAFEIFESPNEPNQQNDPDWVGTTKSFQRNLYLWIKSIPGGHYDLIGPSVTGHFDDLGDISSYMDYANVHDYFDVYNPGTKGWGSLTSHGTYGSLGYNLDLVKVTSSAKPVMSTETGYGAPELNSGSVDFATQLRYITRMYFEHFNHGIVRTYVYEFIDEGGRTTRGSYGNFGMVRSDLSPKPAYTGLKSIIDALNDPGPNFATIPLPYAIGGATADVHHTLLQKRDGTYVIAIWIETPSWHAHGGGDIAVPPQQITITSPMHFSSVSLSTMDEDGHFSRQTLHGSHGGVTFRVTDKVSLVMAKP